MRNWKNINNKHIKEGELFLSFDFLDTWQAELVKLNDNKEGGRYKYPEGLIRYLHTFKVVFGTGYRQQEGILRQLTKWIPIPNVISYSQIQRRINQLSISLVDSLADPKEGQIIAVDSTGIKLYNSGEWIREKHKKRKPFLKLHIGVNTKTKQAVAIEITEDDVGDNKLGLKLIDRAESIAPVVKGLFDGAYDTYNLWNGLHARYIKPLIRLRNNAVINYKKSMTRSQTIKVYKGNENEWVKATGYGQRWQVESWYSSYKRRFGEHCYSTKRENVLREILFKSCLCNTLIV
jgi:hypothetical protein